MLSAAEEYLAAEAELRQKSGQNQAKEGCVPTAETVPTRGGPTP